MARHKSSLSLLLQECLTDFLETHIGMNMCIKVLILNTNPFGLIYAPIGYFMPPSYRTFFDMMYRYMRRKRVDTYFSFFLNAFSDVVFEKCFFIAPSHKRFDHFSWSMFLKYVNTLSELGTHFFILLIFGSYGPFSSDFFDLVPGACIR